MTRADDLIGRGGGDDIHGDAGSDRARAPFVVVNSAAVEPDRMEEVLFGRETAEREAQEKAQRKARETLEIYAPLAHRLGMNKIKWELEDLSFATLHPKIYDEIVRLVAERAPARDDYLASVIDQVQADLRDAKIRATVTGRPKHYYSIYQKMVVRGRDFTDIYDLIGIRVLVDNGRDLDELLAESEHWLERDQAAQLSEAMPALRGPLRAAGFHAAQSARGPARGRGPTQPALPAPPPGSHAHPDLLRTAVRRAGREHGVRRRLRRLPPAPPARRIRLRGTSAGCPLRTLCRRARPA